MSVLENNKTALQTILDEAPPLHYPVFDSYLIECDPTDYPNSQLYKNTNELRYLLEKIKRGSLEDIYPPLFTNNISISDTLSLQSQLDILFNSSISVEEIIELLSQFNINFENKIDLEEISTLISNLNILFNSNLNIEEVINLFSQINLTLNNSITLDSVNNIISNLNMLFESNITIDETINLISQCQIAFNNDISIDNFIQLLSSLSILFNSGLNIEEALNLISNFNIVLANNININDGNNLLSQFNIICNSNLEVIREVYKKLTVDNTHLITVNNINDTERKSGKVEIKLKFKPKSAFPSESQTIVTFIDCFSINTPSYNAISIGIDPDEYGFRVNAYGMVYPPLKADDGITNIPPFVITDIIELTLLMELYTDRNIELTVNNNTITSTFSQYGIALNTNFICNLFNNDFIGDFYYLYIDWIDDTAASSVTPIIKLDAGTNYDNNTDSLKSGIFQNYNVLTNTYDEFYSL